MRPFIYKYNQNLKRSARSLRHKQTDAELLLWYQLRNKQLAGYKFRRQFPIGKFIVDFYCASKKLAIELDGGQHSESNIKYNDIQRTFKLNQLGIKLIRFWDNEVLKNTDGVLEVILDHLSK